MNSQGPYAGLPCETITDHPAGTYGRVRGSLAVSVRLNVTVIVIAKLSVQENRKDKGNREDFSEGVINNVPPPVRILRVYHPPNMIRFLKLLKSHSSHP